MLFLLQLLGAAGLASATLDGIDVRDMIEEMEHIMVDNFGTNSDGFINAVTPCLNYATGSADQGEQSSAEWVRVIFHDFVTANTAAGTGGLDASIGFESDRAENAGLFVNETLRFMNPVGMAVPQSNTLSDQHLITDSHGLPEYG